MNVASSERQIDMDEADRADQEVTMGIAESMRRKKSVGPAPCGACYFCGEDVGPDQRWCNKDCQDDWELEQRRK